MAEIPAPNGSRALATAARSIGLFLFLLLVATPALAGSVNLAWDPPTGPAPAGYKVYYGPAAGNYPSSVDVGSTTSYTVSGLAEGVTYHFAATDYDVSHTESGFSNDVSATVPYSTPVASFSASATMGAAPLAINFLNSSTGTITSYAWTFGDGGTSTLAAPSHSYAAAGVYTVSLTVTGPGGSNTQTRNNYVTVTTAAPVAQFTGSPVSGTFPLTVNFSNTSTGTITSYAWTFGDGGTSTLAAPSHSYAAAGVYTVKLTVTGPGGSNTQTRNNYVTVTTPAPVAQFTGSPVSGTFPLMVNFSNTSTGSITSYAWTFGDGGTSTVAAPSHSYAAAGVYTVSLTVTGPGGSNTLTRNNYVSVASILDTGVYRKLVPGTGAPAYKFILHENGADVKIPFGMAGDVPLVGYINPGGKSSLIIYRNGLWYFDTNRDGVVDVVVGLGGVPGDIPLTANFSGPGGLDDLVIYRAGIWFVDQNLNGSVDMTFGLGGVPGDVPLAGDVNGDGIADLVIYRNGIWYIDTNRNGSVDMTVYFGGMPQDIPMLFDWDGDGKADLCIFRDGIWYVSTKRDGVVDVMFAYGTTGDLPLVGQFH